MLKKFIIGIFKPKFLFRYIVKSKAKSCKGRLSVNGFSTVNNNTHLGYNVNFNGMKITGKGRCTIGEGAVIQAGSVVVKDIPALSVAGGHPAKAFKMRDIEHYNRLKDQKQFF
jgi:acetyltransferase-like isoleucine patch superfamily enzyme